MSKVKSAAAFKDEPPTKHPLGSDYVCLGYDIKDAVIFLREIRNGSLFETYAY